MNDVEYLLKELMQDRITYEYATKHFKPNDYVAVLTAPPYKANSPIIINTRMTSIVDITTKGIVCSRLGLLKYNCILDVIKFKINNSHERRCFENRTQ